MGCGMRESPALRFLYNTLPGRVLLRLLVQPAVSRAAGAYLSSGASKWLVSCYIRKHKIDMKDIVIPAGGFSSFNDFFIRKRKAGDIDAAPGHLISPCDGLLSYLKIEGTTVLDIKNTRFTLEDLLKDQKLAGQFGGGTALVLRLTPAHYHRYCHAVEGKVLQHRKIRGKLHCVRPIALRTVPVFVQNSREYQVVRSKEFGTVIQMEVGALLVGKIQNNSLPPGHRYVRQGREKGYFEFGGSTIILLFQENKLRLSEKLCSRKNSDGEIPVRMGEFLAEAGNFHYSTSPYR